MTTLQETQLSPTIKNLLALGCGVLLFLVNNLYLLHPAESVFGDSTRAATEGPSKALEWILVWRDRFFGTFGQYPWMLLWSFLFFILMFYTWRRPRGWANAFLFGICVTQVIFHFIR